jgi:uncharacterized protein (TIGR00369 family)
MPDEEALTYPGFLPTYDGCYVCGQSHPRGLRARFMADVDGRVHIDFRPDDTQTGYEGVVHGGVISALMDELLGWTIVLQTGRMCFTAELTIRFLKPILVGHTYRAMARPGIERAKSWESHGDLQDQSGRVYAEAQGRYATLSAEQTAAVVARMTYQPGDLPVLRPG